MVEGSFYVGMFGSVVELGLGYDGETLIQMLWFFNFVYYGNCIILIANIACTFGINQ
ncbi:hypothetical protein D3C74_494730 [compost metagenome]